MFNANNGDWLSWVVEKKLGGVGKGLGEEKEEEVVVFHCCTKYKACNTQIFSSSVNESVSHSRFHITNRNGQTVDSYLRNLQKKHFMMIQRLTNPRGRFYRNRFW